MSNGHAPAHSAHREEDTPIRVLLADPHVIFLSGLAGLLGRLGLEVVGQATNEETALALAAEHEPDVVVIDAQPPAMRGAATVGKLTQAAPRTCVVVLSERSEAAAVLDAVSAGAGAYVLKENSVTELVSCIRAAASARSLVLPQAAAELLDTGHRSLEPIAHALSEREIEVLRLIAAGRENSEIAAELFISAATAKSHVSHILEKLKTENRVQAAVFAVRAGLV